MMSAAPCAQVLERHHCLSEALGNLSAFLTDDRSVSDGCSSVPRRNIPAPISPHPSENGSAWVRRNHFLCHLNPNGSPLALCSNVSEIRTTTRLSSSDSANRSGCAHLRSSSGSPLYLCSSVSGNGIHTRRNRNRSFFHHQHHFVTGYQLLHSVPDGSDGCRTARSSSLRPPSVESSSLSSAQSPSVHPSPQGR